MMTFSLGKLPLIIGLGALLASCEQKVEPAAQAGSTPSTAELAREADFGPWVSRAQLQFEMERLSKGEYFSSVEGRLYNGKNQYRAITTPFLKEWAVSWGITENELCEWELRLLRLGFERHNSHVFTDSTGLALHQLVMLRSQVIEAPNDEPLVANIPTQIEPPAPEIAPEVAVLEPDDDQPSPDVSDGPSSIELEPVVSDTGSPESVVSNDPVEEVAEVVADEPMQEDLGAEAIALTEVEDIPEPVDPLTLTEEETPGVAVIVEETEPDPEPIEEEPAPTPRNVSYKVVKGDTLSGIGRRYKVSIKELKKANGLRSDMLRIGQVLKIPGQS